MVIFLICSIDVSERQVIAAAKASCPQGNRSWRYISPSHPFIQLHRQQELEISPSYLFMQLHRATGAGDVYLLCIPTWSYIGQQEQEMYISVASLHAVAQDNRSRRCISPLYPLCSYIRATWAGDVYGSISHLHPFMQLHRVTGAGDVYLLCIPSCSCTG